MREIYLGKSKLKVPTLAVGCMRIGDLEKSEIATYIDNALALGANFFDHADIYGNGECESLFAEVIDMKPSIREKIMLQSKSGIVPGKRFDFSKEYILESVDEILKRLRTDYLDVYLLHRPDALVEPEEVAKAFDELATSGKVRHFGVSNQNPMQMQLLQKYVEQPIVANQLQFSPTNATMVQTGIEVNMMTDGAISRDGHVLDFCRLSDITVQVWSPFQYGFFEGVFLGSDKYKELNAIIDQLAEKYNVSNSAIVVAWILRHPANMQPVIGTTNQKRFTDICKACEVSLTRQEWYDIYLAAGHILP